MRTNARFSPVHIHNVGGSTTCVDFDGAGILHASVAERKFTGYWHSWHDEEDLEICLDKLSKWGAANATAGPE